MQRALLQKAKIIEEGRSKADHGSGNRLHEVHPKQDRQAASNGHLSPNAHPRAALQIAAAAKKSLQCGPGAFHLASNKAKT